METTNHNNSKCSAEQNAHMTYCFAPENKFRGAYFGVDSMLFTILQTNNIGWMRYSKEIGEMPLIRRKREGFCKEKEKLFAKLWGSPPTVSNRIDKQELRENSSDFLGFGVLGRRCLCLV